jgi:serine protease Do
MMGVFLAELTPELAEGFGIRGERGVIIQNVMEDSPAARAGLLRNDVVVEFDGQPVTELQKFRIKVADTPVGSRVPITVLRDGKRLQFTVTLTSRDSQTASAEPGTRANPDADSEDVFGIAVRPLTADEKTAARVESGVVVREVQGGSPADDAGIESGDIIEEVGGKAVQSAAEFGKLLRDAKNQRKHAVLLVNNGNGQSRFVALRLE